MVAQPDFRLTQKLLKMETTVFLVLDINLKVMEDTMVFGTYDTLKDAMEASLKDVISKNGKEIKSHGFQLDGIEYTNNRISNNCSLGSNYGVSYKSQYGNYPCCRMVIPQKVKSSLTFEELTEKYHY
jgi:hypothetical protein